MKKEEIVSPYEIHKLAVEKGWYDKERPVPELLCLIHSEISEALEGYRNDISRNEKGWIGEELADAVIRIFDACQHLGIDIIKEVEKKHTFNTTRLYRHGGKKI
jgi:NTP pyrophosphatase (non-canonical NTP hydrolase)